MARTTRSSSNNTVDPNGGVDDVAKPGKRGASALAAASANPGQPNKSAKKLVKPKKSAAGKAVIKRDCPGMRTTVLCLAEMTRDADPEYFANAPEWELESKLLFGFASAQFSEIFGRRLGRRDGSCGDKERAKIQEAKDAFAAAIKRLLEEPSEHNFRVCISVFACAATYGGAFFAFMPVVRKAAAAAPWLDARGRAIYCSRLPNREQRVRLRSTQKEVAEEALTEACLLIRVPKPLKNLVLLKRQPAEVVASKRPAMMQAAEAATGFAKEKLEETLRNLDSPPGSDEYEAGAAVIRESRSKAKKHEDAVKKTAAKLAAALAEAAALPLTATLAERAAAAAKVEAAQKAAEAAVQAQADYLATLSGNMHKKAVKATAATLAAAKAASAALPLTATAAERAAAAAKVEAAEKAAEAALKAQAEYLERKKKTNHWNQRNSGDEELRKASALKLGLPQNPPQLPPKVRMLCVGMMLPGDTNTVSTISPPWGPVCYSCGKSPEAEFEFDDDAGKRATWCLVNNDACLRNCRKKDGESRRACIRAVRDLEDGGVEVLTNEQLAELGVATIPGPQKREWRKKRREAAAGGVSAAASAQGDGGKKSSSSKRKPPASAEGGENVGASGEQEGAKKARKARKAHRAPLKYTDEEDAMILQLGDAKGSANKPSWQKIANDLGTGREGGQVSKRYKKLKDGDGA